MNSNARFVANRMVEVTNDDPRFRSTIQQYCEDFDAAPIDAPDEVTDKEEAHGCLVQLIEYMARRHPRLNIGNGASIKKAIDSYG